MGDRTPWLTTTPSILPNVRMASSFTFHAVLGEVNMPHVCPRLARTSLEQDDSGQLLGVTHIGDRHVGRKVRDLRRVAILELLKLLGGSRNKDNFVRCCQECLGNSKANATTCAGDNDHLRFHVCDEGLLDLQCRAKLVPRQDPV